MVAWLVLLALTGTSQAHPERRLVVLQAGRAWVLPQVDQTVRQPQGHVLRGHISHLGGLEGRVVRLQGDWREGEVLVPAPRLRGLPVAMEAPPGATRGCLEAEVLSLAPPRARLDLGAGRTRQVDLLWETAAPPEWTSLAPGSRCRLTATVAGGLALDVQVGPPLRRAAHLGPVRFHAQFGEVFLQHALLGYRRAHPESFRWQNRQGNQTLEVSDPGLTLLDCPPGRVRLFGTVTGTTRILGRTLPQVQGRFELVAVPTMVGTDLFLHPEPTSLRLRMTRPVAMEVPAGWTARLGNLLASLLNRDFRVPLPGACWPQLVASGAVRSRDLQDLVVLTHPTGDRRTGLVVVAARAGPDVADAGPSTESGPGPDLLRDRRGDPDGFAVSLSTAAVNALLEREVSHRLPLRRELSPQAGVVSPAPLLPLTLDALEITDLALDYRTDRGRGVLEIRDLRSRVHWRWGPLSGWEPGFRLRGRVRLESRPGPPVVMILHLEPSDLEFLSRRLLHRSPQEQEALRRRVTEGLRTVSLEVPISSEVAVAPLGSEAALELREVQPWEGELVLQGRWKPTR